MPRANPGEVWIVDLGLAAKVRPCLVLGDYPKDDELARGCPGSEVASGARATASRLPRKQETGDSHQTGDSHLFLCWAKEQTQK